MNNNINRFKTGNKRRGVKSDPKSDDKKIGDPRR